MKKEQKVLGKIKDKDWKILSRKKKKVKQRRTGKRNKKYWMGIKK